MVTWPCSADHFLTERRAPVQYVSGWSTHQHMAQYSELWLKTFETGSRASVLTDSVRFYHRIFLFTRRLPSYHLLQYDWAIKKFGPQWHEASRIFCNRVYLNCSMSCCRSTLYVSLLYSVWVCLSQLHVFVLSSPGLWADKDLKVRCSLSFLCLSR